MPKSRFLTAALIIAIHTGAYAQVEAYMTSDQFWSPQGENFVEVTMAIDCNSLVYAENEQGYEQAKVEVLTLIQKENEIVDFKKTELLSPVLLDSSRGEMIHTERFALDPGEFDLVLEIKDILNPGSAMSSVTKQLVVADNGKEVWFSDVQLAESINPAAESASSRGGYNIVPYVSTYFPEQLNKLSFYSELYNTDEKLGKDQDILLTYSIRDLGTGSVRGNYKIIKRAKTMPVVPIIAEFDIEDLPTGHYNLLLEVVDRDGNVLSSIEQYVERSKPVVVDVETLNSIELTGTFVDSIYSLDSVLLYLDCLRPIADPLERKMIEDRFLDMDETLARRLLYSFWASRNPQTPGKAWYAYWDVVVMVNRLYGTRIKQGYQTDRGRVHLQYGAPNTVTDRTNDLNAFPYQIWHFYKAGRFSDKRFVFYLPDLVTNDFVLLHSDVPGEVKEPRWNEYLHERNNSLHSVDRPQTPTHMSGSRADEFYEIPR